MSVGKCCFVFTRLAQALASSFNFQGRVRKTFYVLSDDKVIVGGRRQLQASQAPANTDSSQPMDTDTSDPSDPGPTTAPKAAPAAQTLAAKLSANLAMKRKATDPPDNPAGSDKSKSRR
jgi:hypothetical protein